MNRLDGLGEPELRRTLLAVRGAGTPPTAADVADALGVPRSVARHRLERLAAAGLVRPGFERRTGRTGPGAGRPAKTYAPAIETREIGFPDRNYSRLLALTLQSLPRRGRAAKLSKLGVSYGRELAAAAGLRPARRAAVAFERLCGGLGSLGWHAALVSVAADEAVIETATCPLRPVVVAEPEARAVDEGMWRGLVDAVLPGASVVCATGGCLDGTAPCQVRISLRG